MAILSNVSFSCSNISLKPSLSSLPNIPSSSRSHCLVRCSQVISNLFLQPLKTQCGIETQNKKEICFFLIFWLWVFFCLGQEGKEVVSPLGSLVMSLGEEVSKRSLLALVSASLFFVDPALAFKVTLFFYCII